MMIALDLSPRQTARVIEQAVQSRAKLEVEPRPDVCAELIWGSVESREDAVFIVTLHHTAEDLALSRLVGAMCDVRTILSGQLCLFSTFIVDVEDNVVPRRIRLAIPDVVQVANRRRFARRTPTEPIPVRLTPPSSNATFVGILSNIGPSGLGCRIVSQELDEVLLIGDEILLEFVLPWQTETFRLPAAVCSKTNCGEDGHIIAGFEFVAKGNEEALERLRASIQAETARLTQLDGEL